LTSAFFKTNINPTKRRAHLDKLKFGAVKDFALNNPKTSHFNKNDWSEAFSMAIYHLHAQTIGRGSGKSAVAAAAYRSTSKMTDKETEQICDYTRKEKAIHTEILAPKDAPEWVKDREQLWNSVQEKENRKNSQFAWEYDIALPVGTSRTGYPLNFGNFNYVNMVKDFCNRNFVSKGLVCDIALHKPDKQGDNRNFHAHIMVTTREMTADGWGGKYRRGENKMSDRIDWLKDIRKSWEDVCNERLDPMDHISCRTLEERGIKREPQQHMGPTATAIERKGKTPERTRYQENKWEKGEELLLINEKLRLMNLNEKELEKEAVETIKDGELISEAYATRELLPEIEKADEVEKKYLDQERKKLMKIEKPWEIEEKSLVHLFFGYESTDGKKFKNYEEYKEHQTKLIKIYNNERKVHEEKEEKQKEEKKLIEEIKKSGKENNLETLNKILKLSQKQEKRPAIIEKIKNKAKEIFDKAVELTPYRNFKNAYDEIKASREETERQRKQQEQEQQILQKERQGQLPDQPEIKKDVEIKKSVKPDRER
jgi:hypothetical protein